MKDPYLQARRSLSKKKPAATSDRNQRNSLRLHGTIALDLGRSIVSGRYKPGDLLNGEIVAAERLHVSRTAYREAVRILAAKGLVQPRPKMGTQVNPQQQWHWLDPDVLSWIFQSEPAENLLTNLFELRQFIEPESAALAAVRRTNADLAAMAVALEAMNKYSLADERGQRADQDFHSTLLRASGNVFIVSLINGIAAAVRWTTIFKQRTSPLPRDPTPDHVRVYQAIADADPKAARKAMTNLIVLAQVDINNSRGAAKRANGKTAAGKRVNPHRTISNSGR
jgi:DNA-binding FadR family transcriptional regulator